MAAVANEDPVEIRADPCLMLRVGDKYTYSTITQSYDATVTKIDEYAFYFELKDKTTGESMGETYILHSLIKKGVITIPIVGGSVTLSPAGQRGGKRGTRSVRVRRRRGTHKRRRLLTRK